MRTIIIIATLITVDMMIKMLVIILLQSGNMHVYGIAAAKRDRLTCRTFGIHSPAWVEASLAGNSRPGSLIIPKRIYVRSIYLVFLAGPIVCFTFCFKRSLISLEFRFRDGILGHT